MAQRTYILNTYISYLKSTESMPKLSHSCLVSLAKILVLFDFLIDMTITIQYCITSIL